jgi:DNA-binding transcriptional MerR regulator
MTTLRISDLAKAVSVHPNTVRRYAERGFLPPVARSPSGYRRFTAHHLDCLRVAHQVVYNQYPSAPLRQMSLRFSTATARGDLDGALELAHWYRAVVQAEQREPNLAAAVEGQYGGGGGVFEVDVRPDARAVADDGELARAHGGDETVVGIAVEVAIAQRDPAGGGDRLVEMGHRGDGLAHRGRRIWVERVVLALDRPAGPGVAAEGT